MTWFGTKSCNLAIRQHFLNLALLGTKKACSQHTTSGFTDATSPQLPLPEKYTDHSDSDYNILQLSCQLRRATVKVGSLLLGIITWKKWKNIYWISFLFCTSSCCSTLLVDFGSTITLLRPRIHAQLHWLSLQHGPNTQQTTLCLR